MLGVCATLNTVTLRESTQGVFDFGDAISGILGNPINDAYNKTAAGRKKCFSIHHPEAAMCAAIAPAQPRAFPDLSAPEIFKIACTVKREQYV